MNLKLITIGNNSFEIYDQEKLVIKIKTDHKAKAFRIDCRGKKRVFFVEEGNVKSDMDVVINEYSQPLGFIKKSKEKNNFGIIETEGTKYIYSISIKSSVEVMLYINYDKNPDIFCRFENAPHFDVINSIETKYILFSLTWFLFLNSQKKEELEFAEA